MSGNPLHAEIMECYRLASKSGSSLGIGATTLLRWAEAAQALALPEQPRVVDWDKEQARADRIERDADWVDRLIVEGS